MSISISNNNYTMFANFVDIVNIQLYHNGVGSFFTSLKRYKKTFLHFTINGYVPFRIVL